MAISISKSKASKLGSPSGRDAGGEQCDGLDTVVTRKTVAPYTSGPKPKKLGNGGESPNQFSRKSTRVRGG